MSSHVGRRRASQADIFAALGDATRLSLLRRLSAGDALSITQLTRGTKMTRQAVSKHLRILEAAGIVKAARNGRQVEVALRQAPLTEARAFLDEIGRQWDEALLRLKTMVER